MKHVDILIQCEGKNFLYGLKAFLVYEKVEERSFLYELIAYFALESGR